MQPDEPIEHELLRNAVAAEVIVTNTEVSPTSTGDRYVRIEGRLGDDEESHAEWGRSASSTLSACCRLRRRDREASRA